MSAIVRHRQRVDRGQLAIDRIHVQRNNALSKLRTSARRCLSTWLSMHLSKARGGGPSNDIILARTFGHYRSTLGEH